MLMANKQGKTVKHRKIVPRFFVPGREDPHAFARRMTLLPGVIKRIEELRRDPLFPYWPGRHAAKWNLSPIPKARRQKAG
jgi:hypothetical protein